MRTIRKSIVVRHPFNLKGVGETLPAGTYEIVTDEELIPSLMFEAWRRTSTQLRLPSLELYQGLEQYVTVDPHELDDVLNSQLQHAGHGTPQSV